MNIRNPSKDYSTSTAVIVFAQSGAIDAREKGLKNSSALFDVLTRQTLDIVKSTGLPCFLIDESLQKGSTFGERYTQAIQDVFDRGFNNIISVGNDTPQLSHHHIKTAVNNLEQGHSTIGPSVDGGFYLLGLNKEVFSKARKQGFSGLQWQSAQTLKQLTTLFSSFKESFKSLEVLIDVDNKADAKKILALSIDLSASVIQLLLLLLSYNTSHTYNVDSLYTSVTTPLYRNKGSPVAY